MTEQAAEAPRPIELHDGDAFPGAGAILTSKQIHNHWCVMHDKPDTSKVPDCNWKETKDALLGIRERIKTEATKMLKSRIMEQMRAKGWNISFDETVQTMHSDKVTLKLCKDIFYACFTYPEEQKHTLFCDVANAIVTYLRISFKDPEDNIKCVTATVKETLHTVRKPFMESGKPKRSYMYLRTRDCKEWPKDLEKGIPAHVFAYPKLGGWKYLIERDAAAKKIYDEHKGLPAATKIATDSMTEPSKTSLQQSSQRMVANTGYSTSEAFPQPSDGIKERDSQSSATVTLGDSQRDPWDWAIKDTEDYFINSQDGVNMPAINNGAYQNRFGLEPGHLNCTGSALTAQQLLQTFDNSSTHHTSGHSTEQHSQQQPYSEPYHGMISFQNNQVHQNTIQGMSDMTGSSVNTVHLFSPRYLISALSVYVSRIVWDLLTCLICSDTGPE